MVWSKQYCVTFGNKYASQHPCTGGQSGDLYSHHDLAFGVIVNRYESNPDTAEHKHAEFYGFGFKKAPGKFLEKKARVKLPMAWVAKYPRTQ